MTYYNETERVKRQNVVLIRYKICTREKYIGTEVEYMTKDPDKSDEIPNIELTFKSVEVELIDDNDTIETALLTDDEELIDDDSGSPKSCNNNITDENETNQESLQIETEEFLENNHPDEALPPEMKAHESNPEGTIEDI